MSSNLGREAGHGTVAGPALVPARGRVHCREAALQKLAPEGKAMPDRPPPTPNSPTTDGQAPAASGAAWATRGAALEAVHENAIMVNHA